MTEAKTTPPAIVSALEKACDGLLMPSETDAPFKVVFFERKTEKTAEFPPDTKERPEDEAALSIQELGQLAGAPEKIKVEIRDLDEFFAASATTEDWMNDEEKATAARFAALLEILKTQVKGARVLVWGDAEKQVAIIGEAQGGLAGVTTLIVET